MSARNMNSRVVLCDDEDVKNEGSVAQRVGNRI